MVDTFNRSTHPNTPAIVAHRGLHETLPENSISAFRAAHSAGFVCECDVHRTADGQIVVIHDPVLERTTTGSGAVREKTWSELRDLRLKNSDGSISDEPLPRLADVIGFLGAGLVEVKPPNDPALLASIAMELEKSRSSCRIISFDHANVEHAQRLNLPVGRLVGKEPVLQRILADGWTGPLVLDHRLLSDAIAHRLSDRILAVWTVNDEPAICRVLDLVDRGIAISHIITDRPQWAQRLIDSSTNTHPEGDKPV